MHLKYKIRLKDFYCWRIRKGGKIIPLSPRKIVGEAKGAVNQ